jgi:7-carboxy-7-deazaguanine synthase
MSYFIHEMFYTLQGEGAQAGRAAVFCRFAGCNLWSGREEDRSKAVCKFCDTDFVGGSKFGCATSVAAAAGLHWPSTSHARRLVVCTGGEPMLQLDAELVHEFHLYGFEVSIETNGTLPLAHGIDWVCVSPKANTDLVVRRGNELKLVYPQAGAEPERFADLEFEHFFIQPMDGLLRHKNTDRAVEYCKSNPRWRLSLQTQKFIGIR